MLGEFMRVDKGMRNFIFLAFIVFLGVFLLFVEGASEVGAAVLLFGFLMFGYLYFVRPVLKAFSRLFGGSRDVSAPAKSLSTAKSAIEGHFDLNKTEEDEILSEAQESEESKTESAYLMTSISMPGHTKVSTLQARFSSEFGLCLRVYNGRSYAEPEQKLASIRKIKGPSEIEIAKNIKIANLERKFEEDFGLKVKISGSDDSYLCDGDLTLKAAMEEDGRKLQSRRPFYSEDFKREVALAASKPGATLASVSEQFNTSIGSVRNWKAEYGTEENSQHALLEIEEMLAGSVPVGQIYGDNTLGVELTIPEFVSLKGEQCFIAGSIFLKSGVEVDESTFEVATKFDGFSSIRSGFVGVSDAEEIEYFGSAKATVYTQETCETLELHANVGEQTIVLKKIKGVVFEALNISFDSDGDLLVEGKLAISSGGVLAYSFDAEISSGGERLNPAFVESQENISSYVFGAKEGEKIYLTVATYASLEGELSFDFKGVAVRDGESVDDNSFGRDFTGTQNILNVIQFSVESPELQGVNNDLAYDAISSDDDKAHFVKNAVYEVSGEFARYFGDDELDVRFLVLDEGGAPKALLEIEDIDNGELPSISLLDDQNYAALVLRHSDEDWNFACLKVSEGLNLPFWAIGNVDDDIVRQEYEDGEYSEGYFLDADECINEEHVVKLFDEVKGLWERKE